LDGEKAGFRFIAAGVVAAAGGATQHFEVRPEGAVAAGIGGSVDADDRTPERTGKMERPGVTRDAERNSPRDGYELAERAVEWSSRSRSSLDDGVRKGDFAGADIDYDAETLGDEVIGDGRITLDGPALCSPPGARIDEHGWLANGQDLRGPGIGDGINGKQRKCGREFVPGNGSSQLNILLDDVNAVCVDPLGVEPPGEELAWLGLPNKAATTCHTGNPCRADRTLKIDDGVVVAGAKFTA
jgi:hypothetical protein